MLLIFIKILSPDFNCVHCSVYPFFFLVFIHLAVQEYVCSAQGSHVICTCCFQPMPDRRAEREQNPHVAPQQCVYILCIYLNPDYSIKSLLIFN